MDALVDSLLKRVTGVVTLKLYKGSATVAGRTSPISLYDEDLATFGDGGAYAYAHSDAAGFIRLFGLPMRAIADQERAQASNGASPEAVTRLLKELAGVG